MQTPFICQVALRDLPNSGSYGPRVFSNEMGIIIPTMETGIVIKYHP